MKYNIGLFGIMLLLLFQFSCDDRDRKGENGLKFLNIKKNNYLRLSTNPKILAKDLANPAAPFFLKNRILFSESAKGNILELQNGKVKSLITGFGLDSYAGYPISVMGMTTDLNQEKLIVCASEDEGHIFVYDIKELPTKKQENVEIPFERVEPANPFDVIISDEGRILTATGGTKAAYQGPLNLKKPEPLLPIFEVSTGIAGMTQDEENGIIYSAVTGSGKNDGAIVKWNVKDQESEPEYITTGFTNLVDLHFLPGNILLALEFGQFGVPQTGNLKIVDLRQPEIIVPFVSGLDAPTGLDMNDELQVLISTFGKEMKKPDGMLIQLDMEYAKTF